MVTELQDNYQIAIRFATEKHHSVSHTVKGTDLPYLLHLSNVAMEVLMAYKHTPAFDGAFAVRVALLHDVLEDVPKDNEEREALRMELASRFGADISDAVQALTKDDNLPKEIRMADSLNRIKALQLEVAAVKLADRITNLQPPPSDWSLGKRNAYLSEALTIQNELKGANAYLEHRLAQKIELYRSYCE